MANIKSEKRGPRSRTAIIGPINIQIADPNPAWNPPEAICPASVTRTATTKTAEAIKSK
jgi:hypothetical protein